MYCPDCNLHYPDHLNFCKRCGKALARVGAQFVAEGICCTRCGTRAVQGENFCQQCGARLGLKSEDTTIGSCHVCGILWRSAWLYCKHCGTDRDRALQLSVAVPPPPQSAMPTLATEVYYPETVVSEPPVSETVAIPVSCPVCAADVLPLSRFCDHCGASLEAITTHDLATPPTTTPPEPPTTDPFAESTSGPPAIPTLIDPPAVAPPDPTVALPLDGESDLRIGSEARPGGPGTRELSPEGNSAQPQTRPIVPPVQTTEVKIPRRIVVEIDDVPPMPRAGSPGTRAYRSSPRAAGGLRAHPARGARAARQPALIVGGLLVLALVGGLLIRQLWQRGTEVTPAPAPQPTAQATAAPSASPNPTASHAPALPEGMLLVPGGAFEMGRNEGDEFERPAHAVTVAPFYIDRTEVTNAQYQRFIQATGRSAPAHWRQGRPPEGGINLPVVNVSWDDASAYARWVGKRLPTEEEWEFAARGTDGRLYPWGRDWQPGLANIKDGGSGRVVEVGRYAAGASPFGALDLCGNVWEWTASPPLNYADRGAVHASGMVIRGGAYDVAPERATATYRGIVQPEKGYDKTGFRCVRDAR